MNAYELASQLDNIQYHNGAKPFEIYANMLRQQADRIMELEKDGKVCATCGGLVYDAVLPQTKPLSDEEKTDFTVRIYNCRTGAEAHEIVRAIEAKVRGEK
jgi:hypothetical protein